MVGPGFRERWRTDSGGKHADKQQQTFFHLISPFLVQ
jgi:hypothetical protein